MRGALAGLIAVGALSGLCYAGLWLVPSPFQPIVPVPRFLTTIAAAFALYAVACWLAPRAPLRQSQWVIVGGAVLFRAIAISGPVLYDDDLYRYHWDGRVLAAGINPYRYAPGDHRLAELRDEAWEHVRFKHVQTIYPPLTEAVCAASYLVWPSPQRIRVLALLFDLATMIPILMLLRAVGQSPAYVMVYAWNPLPIKEFANSGHLDSLSIFVACLALWALVVGRDRLSGVWLGLGLLAKGWVALLLPLYIRPRRCWAVLVAAGVALAGAIPFLGARSGLVGGSWDYAGQWEFNSGLYVAVGWLGPVYARAIVGGLWVAVAWLVMRVEEDMVRRAGWLIAAALALSPVCNPWYVCWLLPVLCIHRSRAGLAFTGLVFLSYVYYYDAGLDVVARWVEYGCLAGLAILPPWPPSRGREGRMATNVAKACWSSRARG